MTSFNLISFDIAFYIIYVHYLSITHVVKEIRDDDSKRLRMNLQKVTNHFNLIYTHTLITMPYIYITRISRIPNLDIII